VKCDIEVSHWVWQVKNAMNLFDEILNWDSQAVVQSVFLYGSKTWNLTKTVLAWLKGFHIRAAYPMAKKHKPRRGPNHVWVYPATEDVLKECGMHSILHYIGIRREMIFWYMVDPPIHALCTIDPFKRAPT